MTATLPELAHLHDMSFALYIPENKIVARAAAMAQDVARHYKDKQLRLFCVRRGGQEFFNMFVTALGRLDKRLVADTDSLRVSSYEGTGSTGRLTWHQHLTKPLSPDIHLLGVEDILDTGRTLSTLKHELAPKVASYAVLCMLDKKEARIVPYKADGVGFEIPSLFVVGTGLDYTKNGHELGRDLPGVWAESAAQPFKRYRQGPMNLPSLPH